MPGSSRDRFCRLFHNSLLTSLAANARRIPGVTKLSESPVYGYHAQTMPVLSAEPLEETDRTAPPCPVGPPLLKSISPVGSSRLVPRSNGIALSGSFSDQI